MTWKGISGLQVADGMNLGQSQARVILVSKFLQASLVNVSVCKAELQICVLFSSIYFL